MSAGDGNGWVQCRCGHRHWGRFGAAGLLLLRPEAGRDQALLQLRASWTDAGGTWGLPGGAADSHEDPAAAALREAFEETALDPASVRVVAQETTTDHGDWTYTVVVAVPVAPVSPRAANAESEEVRWVDVAAVADLPLHAGLAQSWPRLQQVLRGADVREGGDAPATPGGPVS